MKQTRRVFLQRSLLSVPLLGTLSACGGGSASSNAVAAPGPAGPSAPMFQPGADLTAGPGVKGTGLVNYSPLPKPLKLQTVTDPDFGSKITRITDAQKDWNSAVACPAYPTTQAWNADETLLILYVTAPISTGGIEAKWGLFDGNTYVFKQWLPINPADVEQFYWSTTDPATLFYVDNGQEGSAGPNQGWWNKLTAFNVSTGVKTVVHDFSTDFTGTGPLGTLNAQYGAINKVSGGEDPFAMSLDNDLIGLGAYLNKNGPGGSAAFQAFSYRISTNTIGTSFLVEGDVPQALPSGRGTYFYNSSTSVNALNAVTNKVVLNLPFNGYEHTDLLRNAAGDDIIAGVQYDGPSGSGTLMWANLTKGGSIKTLIGPAAGGPYPPSGTLTSGRAYRNPGWVAQGIVGNIQAVKTYLDQEVLIANLDTSYIRRVAHHRSTGAWSNASQSNYWAQPNVTISPSGTRILFQSDWGAATPGNSVVANPNAVVDTYVVDVT